MENIRIKDILEAVGGKLLCGDPETEICHVSIDSRKMLGKDIFVPIIGEKADAHNFIDGAFQAGAAAVFTSRHQQMEDTHPWIYVPDTVKALQDLGAYYRRYLTMPVIGITGSVGKTTTRELVSAALAAEKKVYTTGGNSNGQIGVPITICHSDRQAEITVLEMGMSLPGEMARIAAIARPDMAVFTNIGVSHIENLGSREGICREKMHITDGFSGNQKVVMNGEEPLLLAYSNTDRFTPVYYGMNEAMDIYAKDIRAAESGNSFTAVIRGEELLKAAGRTEIFEIPVELKVPGKHNVMNALAALAAACLNGVSPEKAAEALGNFKGYARRLQQFELGGIHMIDDSYNASPDSMKAALEVLANRPGDKKIAVLADMLELGPDSPSYHYEVGEYGGALPVDLYITVGELIGHTAEALKKAGKEVVACGTCAEAAETVLKRAQAGDVVLLKGSNGMHLNQVLDYLRKELQE